MTTATRIDGKPVKSGRGPERTCLGCRAKKDQAGLDRLALSAGPRGPRVVWDKGRRLGGRGAWLCRDNAACLALAVRKRAFGRAFRVEAPLDLTALSAENPAVAAEDDRT